jgi:hypothetical protein
MAKGLITARMVQGDTPDWEPLARFASPYLMSSFMWMYELATRRGERFHAYKHIETRGYAHIDINGNGLAYVPDEDRYERYPAWVLLQAALRPWWEKLNATPEEVALCRIAVERARGVEWGPRPMLTPERRHELALAIEGALIREPPHPDDDGEC